MSAAGPRRVRLLISGRVQGVGFRWATRDRAAELGLAGWVRNLPDGRVEAMAQGPASDIERFIDWCRSGPPLARVIDITVESESTRDDLTGPFELRT